MADHAAAPSPAAKPNLSGQVSRAMLWNAVWQIAKLGAGVVSALTIPNLLTKEDYGTIGRIGALATTFGLIADFGVERGLTKFLPEIEARYGRDGVRRTLLIVLAQKFVVALIIIACCVFFRNQLFAYWESGLDGETAERTRATLQAYQSYFFWALMALIFLGAIYDVFIQTLTAYFKQRASGAIAFVATILSPILRLTVVLVGWGILGLVGVMVTIPLVATVMAAWQTTTMRRELAPRPTQDATGARIPQRLVKYSSLSYWQQITEYFYSVDFVLLALPGVGAVASFKYAHSLINQILSALWSPLAGIQIPLFTRLNVRDDPRQLRDAYALLSKFLAAIMLPAAVGLALLSRNLIVVLSAKYVDGATVASVLALLLFIDAAISVPLAILMAYEQYRPMIIARTCALVAIPLVYLIVPRFGILGAALVMGGVRLVCDGMAMAFAIRDFRLRYPLRFVGRVGLGVLAMALVIAPLAFGPLHTPLPWDPATKLGILEQALYGLGNAALGGIGALVYLGVFKLTGGLDPEDRRRIVELRLPMASRILRFL